MARANLFFEFQVFESEATNEEPSGDLLDERLKFLPTGTLVRVRIWDTKDRIFINIKGAWCRDIDGCNYVWSKNNVYDIGCRYIVDGLSVIEHI